ncbi:hypothetical protein AB6O49_18260 [Streptomyces sp. SBR177]
MQRPLPPGDGLGRQLAALRGANDLVRATRAEVGRDPALYPTAYGRLEAALPTGSRSGEPVPPVRPAALAALARTDVLDTPAWRAHYVCLALADAKAPQVLEEAGLRGPAEHEALAYLRAPDRQDDALTSVATRAAHLRTLSCLGRTGAVGGEALDRLAADTARADRPVPALYAVEALRTAGRTASATRALRDRTVLDDANCAALEPVQRAALTLLARRLTPATRGCLLPALRDPDTQTRWLVRRALTLDAARASVRLPPAVGAVRPDGLVGRAPAQMGTLTATYHAARALAAAGRPDEVPDWLARRLRRLGSGAGLDPSDRRLLAMTCHRLVMSCGPQAERGAEEIAGLRAPVRLTPENERGWYGALAARAEFGLGCGEASAEAPSGGAAGIPSASAAAPSGTALRLAVVLAEAGCPARTEPLTGGTDLVALARRALRDGDLTGAADAVQVALAADQPVPQAFWDELPALLDRYRDPEFPDLYAARPGGVATADATRAAYHLLA